MIPKICLSVVFIAAIYLISIRPNKKSDIIKIFGTCYFAHRGLFDKKNNIPENSMSAFRRAVDFNYGIELDVQKTKDDRLVVFHDASLKRMCGKDKLLVNCTYRELRKLYLGESREKIPLLDDVLNMIEGKVPIIIEIKSEGDWKKTTKLLSERMKKYTGKYCVESFHPLTMALYRKLQPQIPRGQLSSNMFKEKDEHNLWIKFMLTNLMFNFLSRPDFIGYNYLYSGNLSYRILRKLFPVANAAWTIRNAGELKKCKAIFDLFIFEGFMPKG